MTDSKILKIVLLISGSICTGIGGAIVFVPADFHAIAGIDLGESNSLLGETRASGGLLLVSGILILGGAIAAKLRFTSIVISTAVYLSYGFSRLFSLSVDGMPHDSLVQAAVLELVIGLICFYALVRYREQM